jgi:GAF domain-containing protein
MLSVPRLRAQFRRALLPAMPCGGPPRGAGLPATGSQERDAVLTQVGEMLVPQFADHCFIDIVHGGTLIRSLQRHAGDWTPPPGIWAPTGGQVHYPAGHFCQQAMALLDTVMVTDMKHDNIPAPSAPSKALSQELEVTSVLAAPLYANGELIGVIAIARSRLTSRTQQHFTTCDRDLLTTLAGKAAIAIGSAQCSRSLRHARPVSHPGTWIIKLLRAAPQRLLVTGYGPADHGRKAQALTR